MSASSLIVEIHRIPEEGLQVKGQLSAEVFGLRDKLAKPLSGIRYDLHLMRCGPEVLAQGSISADFDLQCSRTLDYFTYTVDLPDYAELIECENPDSVDLTDRLREDILLALPAYPHSPGAEREPESDAAESPIAAGASSRGSVWDSLDGLEVKG